MNKIEFEALFKRKDAILRRLLDGIAVSTQPDVICDIGSFDGTEIARFRQLVPSADCHAFEANPRNVGALRERPDLAGVTIHEVAVADHDGETAFTMLEADGDNSDWRRAAGSLRDRNDDMPASQTTVPCVRLDTVFAREIAEERTFLLWIDVEGALDRMMAGAEGVLRCTMALRVELERVAYWKDQMLAGDAIAKFAALGFQPIGDSYTPELFGQSDVLFLNREWLSMVVAKETRNDRS